MSARSNFFTVATVSGSFSATSTLEPSRVVIESVLPSSPAIVPRMRVGGAVCANAAVADRHAASASGIRRASTFSLPLCGLVPPDDGDDPAFGKGMQPSMLAGEGGIAMARAAASEVVIYHN